MTTFANKTEIKMARRYVKSRNGLKISLKISLRLEVWNMLSVKEADISVTDSNYESEYIC